ncbi:MAG: hypothetical protein GY935_22110 [Gammaproteobacteria bacterium]|nr:hypothetical protein [Gammaproteobacteria bacterium]
MGFMLRTCLLLLLLGLQYGCASYAKFPVDAQLLEEPIKTTVDSESAQYYLNHYLQGERLDKHLDLQIDTIYRLYPAALPSREELKQIADQFSNDFAALFLADKLWQDQQNRQVQKAFHHYMAMSEEELFRVPASVENYLVLWVPGWNYERNGHITGSDFAAPRRLINNLGIESELILVPSNGSVEQSADVIADVVLRQSKRDKKIIIVGASAAGPAIHYTLGKLLHHTQLNSVVAWVNLGGILQGSPLIDYFQKWPQKLMLKMVLALYDWENEEIMSMSARYSRERIKTLELPPDMVVINYLGLSLTGSLSSLSEYKYPLIAVEGPNDGLTPLVDIIAPGSMTLVATQSDHYFGEDPDINKKTIAIVKTVLEMIGRQLAN